jgi:hypothetical protein
MPKITIPLNANCPITTDDSTIMAPTERSMPAVRTTSVWAAPTMPTMATCCRINVSENELKNLTRSVQSIESGIASTRIPNIKSERMRMINGAAALLACRKC